ncbi:hypothetical protein [Ekhidna sp.]|uniref:hypothetical protein n=1 Tax=Ekhidna sp. TaxID=2608089 RepID=UPI003B502427
MTHILWYNNSISSYQSGTWNDFKQTVAKSVNPHEILPLERFNDASELTIKKIAFELNKCRPRHLR